MKYQVTVQFEGRTPELAEFAFQNAIEKIAWADGAKFREASLLIVDPAVEAIQTLRPEDFSNWEGHRKANEENAAYAKLIPQGGKAIRKIVLQRLYNSKSNTVVWNEAMISAIRNVEEVDYLAMAHPDLPISGVRYELQVQDLENEGLTRSDAQAVVDAKVDAGGLELKYSADGRRTLKSGRKS